MIEQAGIALAESLTKEETEAGLIYPRLTRIREVSARIACAVIKQAQEEVSDTSIERCAMLMCIAV